MAKAMTKSQIAGHLAGKAGITKRAAGQLFDDLAALVYKEAKNTFTLPGIGKLVLVNRKARIGRNPQTGASINIPAKRVVKFRVAKTTRDVVLGVKPGTAFGPIGPPPIKIDPPIKPPRRKRNFHG